MAFPQLHVPPSRSLDANANPYSGAKWFFYQTGTTTPLSVYADAGLTTPLGTSVTADSGGKFPNVYMDGTKLYRAVCRNASGSITLHDIDPANELSPLSELALTTSGKGASLVKFENGNSVQDLMSSASGLGLALLPYLALNSTFVRSQWDKNQELVSLHDYYNPALGISAFPAAWNLAFANCPTGGTVIIPPSLGTITFTSGGALTVPADKNLIIATRITSTAASRRIVIGTSGGSTTVQMVGSGWLHNVFLRLEGGTPVVTGGGASGYLNTACILIENPSGTPSTYFNIRVNDMQFRDCNYGVLRQGNNTGSTAIGSMYSDLQFYNLRGDPVELNVITQDRATKIDNIHINLVDGTNANWGLGVGVANATDVQIANIYARSLKQVVHVEYSNGVFVGNVNGDDITNSYSTAAGIESGLVVFYGGIGNSVDGVALAGGVVAVRVGFGVTGGVYNNPPKNMTIRNVTAQTGSFVFACGAETSDTNSYAVIENVTLQSGGFSWAERCHSNILRNVYARRNRATSDFALELGMDMNADGRQAFRASGVVTLEMQNLRGVDQWGAANVGHMTSSTTPTKVTVLSIGGGQQNVQAINCNFAVGTGAYNGSLRANRTFQRDYGAAGFPYGLEVVPGDIVINRNATPGQWMVLTSGSVNRASDTFTLYDKANRIIVSSAPQPWVDPNYHEMGQRITCSNIGAPNLDTTVVRTYFSGGSYYMELSDTPTGTDGVTTGTITATQTATYIAI